MPGYVVWSLVATALSLLGIAGACVYSLFQFRQLRKKYYQR